MGSAASSRWLACTFSIRPRRRLFRRTVLVSPLTVSWPCCRASTSSMRAGSGWAAQS
ncbi:hypothetical protein C4J93_0599 [Pseudomonas sp. R2-37-08W]|nr:hypothetical protein C4J93_0599 [Pseudomonas sp. R2-37-08W]